MINYHCIVEYDGTLFYGWGKQPNKRTVQGEIEKALFKIFNTDINIVCAGRTDKGVHAIGQSISFFAPEIEIKKLILRINSLLPHDICIKSAVKTVQNFNARKSAKYKTYIYKVYNSPIRAPLYRNYSWHISKILDIEKMKKAAEFLKGKKDFTVFDSYNSVFDYKEVNIKEIKIIKKDGFIDILVTGDRFLYKMVRKIAGELVRIGIGIQTFEIFKEGIITKDKSKIGKPAPSYALYLAKITY